MINMLNSGSIWQDRDILGSALLLMVLVVVPVLFLPWFYRKKIVLCIHCVLSVLSMLCFAYIAFNPFIVSGYVNDYGASVGVAWLLRLSGLLFGLALLIIPVVFAFRKKGGKQLFWLYLILLAYLIIAYIAEYFVEDALMWRVDIIV